MKTVRDILETQGVTHHSDMSLNDHYKIEPEQFMPLNIEKVYEDIISVSHTYTQRGDLMNDPEIRYNIEGFDGHIGRGGWNPVEYRQDGFPQVFERDEDGLGMDVEEFARDWDARLRQQGYLELAEQGLIQSNTQ